MKLKLYRQLQQSDGIFSVLKKEDGTEVAQTLEHAYDTGLINGAPATDIFKPKLKPGTYTCKRGPHKLKVQDPYFDTFEITGVKGHSGILFHAGNYNRDSNGCVLLGEKRAKALNQTNATLMVTNSRATFAKFMKMLDGIDSFELEVI